MEKQLAGVNLDRKQVKIHVTARKTKKRPRSGLHLCQFVFSIARLVASRPALRSRLSSFPPVPLTGPFPEIRAA